MALELESLQATEVEESWPVEERVTRAEEGSSLYFCLIGAWVCFRVAESIVVLLVVMVVVMVVV